MDNDRQKIPIRFVNCSKQKIDLIWLNEVYLISITFDISLV